MEIQPSIISQAIYGKNGRVAIPMKVFMKQSNTRQVGGKKDIEHLGVPLVVALVNINMNKPCNHSYDFGNPLEQNQELEPEELPTEFEPISDEVYDSLFNTVLDEHIETEPESYSEESPVKKYTRKNRTILQ
jgi:hypothetical protein